MDKHEGDDEVLDLEIDELFKDDTSASEEEQPAKTPEEKKDELTKTVTKRINEVKAKTERETQDKIAKELGYENYAAMKKAQEDDIIKKKGYKPEDIASLVETLVEKRIKEDPRLAKLTALEESERDKYVEAKLAAINEATGQKLTVKDLPKETVDLWAKGIDLEQAYYATQGKTVIAKVKNQANNGSLDHLNVGGSSGQPKMRRLTAEEKEIYRSIAPHLTEDELNKKTVEVKSTK